MIIARSPLRITLGGGGTDLPSYYNEYGGFVISAAIKKYIYVAISKPFKKGFLLKYSDLENELKLNDIKHPIIRESLKLMRYRENQIEIITLSDIPSGTGLGSSGSFSTALLNGLHEYIGKKISKRDLAEMACHIEMNVLKEPCGKQDQYISSFGGIKSFEFKKNRVDVKDLPINKVTLKNLKNNLILFFTGYSRSSSSILKTQDIQSKNDKSDMLENLHFVKDIGLKSKKALIEGNMIYFAKLMNIHWFHKKKRSKLMSNNKINKWYEIAMKNGALGGKLVGAGGGGFLMFYASRPNLLRNKMKQLGLTEVEIDFDYDGSAIMQL